MFRIAGMNLGANLAMHGMPDVACLSPMGYRVYKDGIRISAGLTSSTAFFDSAYSNYSAHVYEVCAIDAAGQEGARVSVTIPRISAALQGYGSMVDGAEALNRGFFDTIRPAFTNNDSSALALGAAYLDITVPGTDTVARSTIAAVNIAGGATVVPAGVVSSDPRWPAAVSLKVSAALPAAPGTEAVFSRGFVLAVRNPVEPVIELSHQPFVLGADAAVTLKFNNRGSAALDIETARIRDDQPVEGGMVSVELRTSGGLLLAKKGLTQTSGGVLWAMVDSTLPGDGTVEQELAYYASIPAGSGFLFAPVMAPVPSSVSGKLLLSASVSRPVFDLSSTAVAGLRAFQALQEASPAGSAPYVVSVAPDAPVYDQNTPITLRGEARAGSGELLAGASVQAELSGRGYTRVLSGVTDGQGRYAVVFNPMPGEAGIYTLAAFPPTAINHAVKSTFTITGFAFEPLSYSGTMSQNSAIGLDIALKNTGETPLAGLAWQAESVTGSGVSVALEGLPATLEAGTKAALKLRAQAAVDASALAEYKITITDANGFARTLPVSLSVMQAAPLPAATPSSFQIGLLAGETKTQTILIQNKGFNTWSGVNAVIAPSVASWVRVQGAAWLGDIAPGGSASLVLSITPPAEFPSDTYAAANLVEVRSGNAGTLNTGADGKAVFAGIRVYQILCLLLMAVGVAQAQNIVSPEELKNMLAEKKKVEVVDVRPAGQFFARHIDGAINVPLADVKAHKFPKKKALVLYCGGMDCSLSRKAAKVLADKGYKDVRVLVGGLPAWQSKGYAVMPPAPAPAAVAHSVVPRITAAELIKALPGTCVVIDVRSKDEFSAGHIKGAVNIPLEDIPGGVPVEAKGKRLVVYSRLPASSAKAAGLLAKNGFTVLELTGGLGVWAALGYPVEAGALTAVK